MRAPSGFQRTQTCAPRVSPQEGRSCAHAPPAGTDLAWLPFTSPFRGVIATDCNRPPLGSWGRLPLVQLTRGGDVACGGCKPCAGRIVACTRMPFPPAAIGVADCLVLLVPVSRYIRIATLRMRLSTATMLHRWYGGSRRHYSYAVLPLMPLFVTYALRL